MGKYSCIQSSAVDVYIAICTALCFALLKDWLLLNLYQSAWSDFQESRNCEIKDWSSLLSNEIVCPNPLGGFIYQAE